MYLFHNFVLISIASIRRVWMALCDTDNWKFTVISQIKFVA